MINEIKAFLTEALAKQAYAALLTIPGFGWVFALPVVRQLTQFLIERILKWGIGETAIGLSVLWIIVDMSYEISSAEDARKKLDFIINNPTKYSDAQQKQILEHFDDTTIDLIQLGLKRL